MLNLIDDAERNNITVIEQALPPPIAGICIQTRKRKKILLHDHLLYKKSRETLAHELGHYHTGCPDLIEHVNCRDKYEHYATLWSVQKLMPFPLILEAYEGGARETWDFAESLNITDEFFCNGITIYYEKYGICVQVDGYTIFFDPFMIEVGEEE